MNKTFLISLCGAALLAPSFGHAAKDVHVPTDMIVQMTLERLQESSDVIRQENEHLSLQNTIIQDQIKLLKQEIKAFDEREQELENELSGLKGTNDVKEAIVYEGQSGRLQDDYAFWTEEYQDLMRRVAAQEKSYQEIFKEMEAVLDEVEGLEKQIGLLSDFSTAEEIEKQQRLQQELNKSRKDLAVLEAQIADLQAEAGTTENIQALEKENYDLSRKIVSLEDSKAKSMQEFSEQKDKLERYLRGNEGDFQSEVEELMKLRENFEEFEGKVGMIEAKISADNYRVLNPDEITQLKKRLSDIRQENQVYERKLLELKEILDY